MEHRGRRSPPWAEPGWWSEAKLWIDQALRVAGVERAGPLATERRSERTTSRRIPFDDGAQSQVSELAGVDPESQHAELLRRDSVIGLSTVADGHRDPA